MEGLTPSQKGGVAELKIAATAAELGYDVYRPMPEGTRCDLVLGCHDRLVRIQCKSAHRDGDMIGAGSAPAD
jgi:hypothetical protein